MVKLARNEECIALYPLAAHYSIGSFLARVTFQPSDGPFILGLISTIRLLTAHYWPFLLVGQFSPWLQSARLWPFTPLGPFHSVIKYD